MGSRFSDAALRQYALWSEGVLKYAYDSSISGDKLQSYPIRVTQDWVIRNGPRARYTGAVAIAPSLAVEPSSILVGVVLGWLAKAYLEG